jgi:hypothetical protein
MKHRPAIVTGALLAGLSALALSHQVSAAQANAGWVTLLDGSNMNNFNKVGDANWRVVDGAVQADKGMGGFLVTKNSYSNFQIRAEVWVDTPANSGIFIRCADPAKPGGMACYEVNIFDTRPEKEYGTGAIVNVAKVNPMPLAGNKWNVMEIEANGPVFNVVQWTEDCCRRARRQARRRPFALSTARCREVSQGGSQAVIIRATMSLS